MLNYLDLNKWHISRILEEAYCIFYDGKFVRSVTREPKKLTDGYKAIKLTVNDLVSVKLVNHPAKNNEFVLKPPVSYCDIIGASIEYHFEHDGESYDVVVVMPNGLLIELDKQYGFDENLHLNIGNIKNLRMVFFNENNQFFLLDKDMEMVKSFYNMQEKAKKSEYDYNHIYVKGEEEYLYAADFYTPVLSITSKSGKMLEWNNVFKKSHVFIKPRAALSEFQDNTVLIVKTGENQKFDKIVKKDDFYTQCSSALLFKKQKKVKTIEEIQKICLDNAESYSIEYNRYNVFDKVIGALYSLETYGDGIKKLIKANSMHFTEEDIKNNSSINKNLKIIQSLCKNVIFSKKENIEIKDIFYRMGIDFDKFKYYDDELTKGKIYAGKLKESGNRGASSFGILGKYLERLYVPDYRFQENLQDNTIKILATDEVIKKPLFFNCYFSSTGGKQKLIDFLEQIFQTGFANEIGEQNIYPLYELTKTEAVKGLTKSVYDRIPSDKDIDYLMDVFYEENISNIKKYFREISKDISFSIKPSELSFKHERRYKVENSARIIYCSLNRLGHHDEKETLKMMDVFSDFENLKAFLEKY